MKRTTCAHKEEYNVKKSLKVLCLTLIFVFAFSNLAFAVNSTGFVGAESSMDSNARKVLAQIVVGDWPSHYYDSSAWIMLFNKASAYDYAQAGFMKSSDLTGGSNAIFIESNDPSIFRSKTFQYWMTTATNWSFQITFDEANGKVNYYHGGTLLYTEALSNFSWRPTYRQYMSEIKGDSYWFGASLAKGAINLLQYATSSSGWIQDTPATWFYGVDSSGHQYGYVSSTGANSFNMWDTRN